MGGDGVDADALLGKLLHQPLGPDHDRALRGGVVDHVLARVVGDERAERRAMDLDMLIGAIAGSALFIFIGGPLVACCAVREGAKRPGRPDGSALLLGQNVDLRRNRA